MLEEETWDPLGRPDYFWLSVASIHQALVLVAVAHIWCCRHWPPYVVKNVSLVCLTGTAGVINLIGIVISFGFFEYTGPSLLSNCFFEGLLVWTGAGLFFCAAVVRVYRNYMVLIRHSVAMWRPATQVLLLQAPIWLASTANLSPSVTRMDFDVNRCIGSKCYVLFAAYNYAGVLLVAGTVLMWKMRNVRKQMNEYRVMIYSLAFLMLSVVVFDALAAGIDLDHTVTRRVALAHNIVRTALLFWPMIITPLWKFLKKDAEYAGAFAVGLTSEVTPAQLRGSLADQLKLEEIWAQFSKIAEERMSASYPSFYKACMIRDKEEGYFERQAKTMDIIGTFVGEGAPSKVDISDGCRARILASEVSRCNIFDEAAAEVLSRMQEVCGEAFKQSEALTQLLSKAEKEEAELEALKKAKPSKARSSGGSGGVLASSSDGSRSDRWISSTVTGRKMSVGCWRARMPASTKSRPATTQHRDSVEQTNALTRVGRADSTSVGCSGLAPEISIVGNRSNVASQRNLGLSSPVDTVGCGHASPLSWLVEEVKDIEMGNASSGEEGDITTPSTLSMRRDSSLFNSTTRTPNLPEPAPPPPPLPQAPVPPRSPMSSPSPSGCRPPLPAPPPAKRQPPAPWAAWRRSPKSVMVAPSNMSPPETPRATAGARVGRAAPDLESGEAGGDRGGMRKVNDAEDEVDTSGPAVELGLEEKTSFVESLAGSIAVRVPPSPSWSSPAVSPSPKHRRSPFRRQRLRRPSPPSNASQLEDSGETVQRRGAAAVAADIPQQFPSTTVASPTLTLTTGIPEYDRKYDDLADRMAQASLSSHSVWTSSPARTVGVRQHVPSRTRSFSDSLDPRNSGATCWSSGVGGEAGMREGGWVGFDDALVSSPVRSSVMSGSPFMKPRSPVQVPVAQLRSPSPPHAGGIWKDSDITGDEYEPTLSPPTSGSSASNPPQACEPPPDFEREAWHLPLALFNHPSSSSPLISLPRTPPSSTARAANIHDADAAVDGETGGGIVTRECTTEASEAPEASLANTSPPFTSPRQHQAQPRTPPLEETRSSVRHAPPTVRRGDKPRREPLACQPKLIRAPRNFAATQRATLTAPQPPRAMQPARGLPAHALPARAPAWGETSTLSAVSSSTTRSSSPEATPAAVSALPSSLPSPPQPSSSSRSTSHTPPPPFMPSAKSPMSPPQRPQLHLLLEMLAAPARPYAPPTQVYTPPSPAGRSSSVSPSSVRSSPMISRSHLMNGGGMLLAPPLPPRDPGPSAGGVPLFWSWSDSTLSGCSRSGGVGGGASSACLSASPDPSSPLVGIRFIPAGEPSTSSAVSGRAASIGAGSFTSAGVGAKGQDKVGARDGSAVVSNDEGSFDGVETGKSRSTNSSPVGPAAAAGGAIAGEGEGEGVRRTEVGRHGGVGGREGKRPRRYFFPL